MAWLVSSPFYPSGPVTNGWPTSFDTSTFTGGDLAGDAAFGALGSNHGDSLSGWITPKASGRCTFFIASDDPSELYLNPNGADPAGAVKIAEKTDCCDAFQDYGVTNDDGYTLPTSEAISLVAGQSYFIQALSGGEVTISWTGTGTLYESSEVQTRARRARVRGERGSSGSQSERVSRWRRGRYALYRSLNQDSAMVVVRQYTKNIAIT